LVARALFILTVLVHIVSYSQEFTCDDFREGSFYLVSEDYPDIFHQILRKGRKQIELNQDGEEYHYNIQWIDDCSYILRLDKKNHNRELDSLDMYIEQNGGVFVEFVEIKDNCMIGNASITRLDDEVSKSIICLKPQ
jgi:hypothetical protein